MKLLSDILIEVPVMDIRGPEKIAVKDLKIDSGRVQKGDLFAAIRGTRVDGHDYIPEAVRKQASVIVCEDFPSQLTETQTWVRVASTPATLGRMAAAFFDRPSSQLQLIGITGTNGKTSIATFLYRIFEACGFPSGLISTIRTTIHRESQKATHTTPDAVVINRLLKRMVDAGCSYAFLEVSSHAIDQNRIAGLHFSGAVFTNLTHDHLDYHGSFKNYLNVKKSFFDGLPEKAFALVNADDRNGMVMVQNSRARKYSYGIKKMADFRAKIVERSPEGALVKFENSEVWIPFIGDFSAYNLLAAFACCRLLDLRDEEVLKVISNMGPVPGRLETIHSKDGHIAIVDYAHTPDALQNVLKSIQQIIGSGCKIITVVGAGGDRDRSKRPVMANIVTQYSYRVLLTSDNPRSEDPESIIQEMVKGIPYDLQNRVLSITNRREAIKTACLMAGPGDIILVAGKGHEDYQEIKGKRHHFDDREVVREFLNQKANTAKTT